MQGEEAKLEEGEEESKGLEEEGEEEDIAMQEEGGFSLADNTQDFRISIDLNQQEPHYKLYAAQVMHDMEWTITLARNDFPWHEVQFGIFNAKDCYEKYYQIVRDSQTFLKKVLGMKEKYKKMLAGQMQLQAPQTQLEALLYCKCKGQVISDILVKCDGDADCINKGWMHPCCTTDEAVKGMTQDQLDGLEEWYCEDCKERMRREEEEEEEEDILQEGEEIQTPPMQGQKGTSSNNNCYDNYAYQQDTTQMEMQESSERRKNSDNKRECEGRNIAMTFEEGEKGEEEEQEIEYYDHE